jgi:hypothetical protein
MGHPFPGLRPGRAVGAGDLPDGEPARSGAQRGADMQEAAARLTSGLHARLGLPIPAGAVPTLITLYQGALFTLLAAPPGYATEDSVRPLAHAIVHGTLPGWPAADCPVVRQVSGGDHRG